MCPVIATDADATCNQQSSRGLTLEDAAATKIQTVYRAYLVGCVHCYFHFYCFYFDTFSIYYSIPISEGVESQLPQAELQVYLCLCITLFPSFIYTAESPELMAVYFHSVFRLGKIFIECKECQDYRIWCNVIPLRSKLQLH